MVRRRRRRGSEGRLEHAHRQSDGRLPHRLRHERRGLAAAATGFRCASSPRLRGHLPHQVSAAHQGRRPVLHELQRLRTSPIRIRRELRSAYRSDPSRSSRTHPADSSCPAADSTRSAGWPGPAGAPFVPWRSPPMAGRSGTCAELKATPQRMAHIRFGYPWTWDGNATEILSRATDEIGQVQATARADRPVVERAVGARLPSARARQQRHALEDRQGRERDQWARLGLSRFCCSLGSPAFAQSPTYGVGRTPTAEEIRRMDISIGPTGEELPPGRGTAKEGAQLFEQKGCIGCHGPAGLGGTGARAAIEKRPRMSPSGNGSASCHCARRLRRRCGITSIAACLPGMRGLSSPMRSMR